MTQWNTAELIAADKRFVWHPFTNMPEWCAPGHEPLVLVEGNGALLRDSRGREYIDGNSSIWTNIHGHNHPHINAAIRRQLDRVAHTSFLGFTSIGACGTREGISSLPSKAVIMAIRQARPAWVRPPCSRLDVHTGISQRFRFHQ